MGMIQSVTFELKPCVMIVTPPAVTEPVEQSTSRKTPKKQRKRLLRSQVLNAEAAFRIRIFRVAFALASQRGLSEELVELFEKERV
jgi:hypothetical protein